jgi:flagellar biosynthesis protein FlhF
MEVRSYEALTIREAIRNVKRELGDDAVILSIRNKAQSGNDKLKSVEVRATAASARSLQGGSQVANHQEEQHGEVLQGIQSLQNRMQNLAEQSARRDHIEGLEMSLREMRSLLAESIRNHHSELIRDLPPSLRQLEDQLKISGVQAKVIIDLIRGIQANESSKKSVPDENKFEHYRAEAIKWLMKRIHIAPKWTFEKGSPSFHVLVGGSGVGKTSTLAKLATHFVNKEKTNLTILSMDQCRIAATEQLRVYAKVIGSPFYEVESLEDIQSVVRKSPECSAYLIDTAGIGLRRSSEIKSLKAIADGPIPFDFHLVLSATEKSELLERQVSFFSPLGIRSLIFTKLDEAPSYGDILNENLRWSVPLSYFSTGMKVPEDIERASRERIIERILDI